MRRSSSSAARCCSTRCAARPAARSWRSPTGCCAAMTRSPAPCLHRSTRWSVAFVPDSTHPRRLFLVSLRGLCMLDVDQIRSLTCVLVVAMAREERSAPMDAPDALDLNRLALPEVVARRIRGAFGSTYLTLMSVMQGVALAVLAARITETAGTFDLGDWVVTINTFVVFVVIWNEYLVAALAFAWIPTFLDSLLPFSLL